MTTATEPRQLLSGWCGQQGKPDCERCTSSRCEHSCHAANPAQPRALHDVSAVDFWENRDAAEGCVNTQRRLANSRSSTTKGGLVK